MLRLVVACALFGLAFAPVSARRAVTFDAATQGDTNGSAGSLSFSVTVSAGSDLVMIVGVSLWQATVSSATFNGDALTLGCVDSTGDVTGEMWYLVNPDVTTGNLVITPSTSSWISAGASVWSGVDQGSPFSDCEADSDATGPPTLTIASATGEVVVDVLAFWNQFTPTQGAGQTTMWVETEATNDNKSAGSYEAGAASVTMSWTINVDAENWAIAALSLTPAGGVGGGSVPVPGILGFIKPAVVRHAVSTAMR